MKSFKTRCTEWCNFIKYKKAYLPFNQLVTREWWNLWGITENKYMSDQRRISRKEQYVEGSLNNKENSIRFTILLYSSQIQTSMSKILSFLLIILWSEIYLFSVIPTQPTQVIFQGQWTHKSQSAVLPNSMKKGKNLESLITATSQGSI
jgi:hypothetical protein